jgi:acyl-homoserine-lactone acylase
MLLADRVKPALLQALRGVENPSTEIQSGLQVLEAWDNAVSASSRGAILFQRFWDTYSQAIQQPYAIPWDPAQPAATPSGIGDPAQAVKSLEEAVRWTRQRYGAEDVAWGDVNRFRAGALDVPGDGASGNYGLFRVVQFTEVPDGKRAAGHVRPNEAPVGFGDAWVIAMEFSKPVRAISVLAYGQTTRADSPHSSDQLQLFAEHMLRPVWFSESDIKANLEREYRPR